jgi:hypothetical protein
MAAESSFSGCCTAHNCRTFTRFGANVHSYAPPMFGPWHPPAILVHTPHACSYEWVDDDTICASVLPQDLGPPPTKPATPFGPRIEDNSDGKTSQARTYPDLLQSTHDEELFQHYGTSQLVTVKVRARVRTCAGACLSAQHAKQRLQREFISAWRNRIALLHNPTVPPLHHHHLTLQVSTGEVTRLGPPRVYTGASASPDARYLLVSWLERPYSYAGAHAAPLPLTLPFPLSTSHLEPPSQ